MAIKRTGATILIGALMLSAAAAGPSMSSAWLSITIDQDTCVAQATKAVRAQSFNTRFEVVGGASVYGERGDYTALVRCASSKGIAYFVVAGPKSDLASRYMNAMRDNF